jgi:FXSXX-COOH protein
MDEVLEAWLPDVTGMPLHDLLASGDPDLLAAVERLVDQVVGEPLPVDGCCC